MQRGRRRAGRRPPPAPAWPPPSGQSRRGRRACPGGHGGGSVREHTVVSEDEKRDGACGLRCEIRILNLKGLAPLASSVCEGGGLPTTQGPPGKTPFRAGTQSPPQALPLPLVVPQCPRPARGKPAADFMQRPHRLGGRGGRARLCLGCRVNGSGWPQGGAIARLTSPGR